jgi:hypothetical protein
VQFVCAVVAVLVLVVYAVRRRQSCVLPSLELILACLLLALPAQAQLPVGLGVQGMEAQLDAGAGLAWTNAERTEHFRTRLTVAAPISSSLRVFVRADLSRTQDGGDLADPQTFRSVEAALGVRYRIAGPVSVGLVGGVTYSAEGDQGAPADGDQASLLGVLCADYGKAYLCSGAGQRDPVGGRALVVALSIPLGDRFVAAVDYDYPLSVERPRALVFRFAALYRVKTF